MLDVPGWPGHVAGQHVDVRLTAEDGYVAERSYSIASAPEDAPRVALTVERIDDGEVSPYLAGELVVGDQFEVRGPVGGHFTWRAADGGPLLLVGGGSGLVPLMAMVRHRAAAGSRADTRLLVSARELEAVLYREELERLASARRWAEHHLHLDARGARAVGRVRAAGGCGDAGGRGAAGGVRAARVRVRADAVRRGGGGCAGGVGARGGVVHTERFGPTGG